MIAIIVADYTNMHQIVTLMASNKEAITQNQIYMCSL